MFESAEKPTPQFEKAPLPDLRVFYSAEKIETVPYVTLWKGQATESSCVFQTNPDISSTAVEIEKFRDSLIKFQTSGKNYRDDPKARLVNLGINTEGKPVLTFQKVMYSDYIITNNSIDIVIPELNKTIREILEPGPKLKPLNESECSNHLGLSCIVLTQDNKVILQRAGGQKVTGAGQITSSASGAMDFKEPFVNPFEVMQAEISEELGLTQEESAGLKAIAIGRELARGGKPEMFFVLETDLTSEEILGRTRSDPDKEVESLLVANSNDQELNRIISDPGTSQSTKGALHYFLASRK